MITDSFDNKTPAPMTPRSFYGEGGHLCDICIGTFSGELFKLAQENFACREVARINSANGSKPLLLLDAGGLTVGLYLSFIGAPGATADVIEAAWLLGATKFILFGSAGSLCREKTEGKFVVPTEAYRDEGVSYHYAPPADYITIANSRRVAAFFEGKRLPYITARDWTTDAFYRETVGQTEKRRREGCVSVEMELAALQAVCDFHHFELYDFLVTGDVLGDTDYMPEGLRDANHRADKLYLALELAAEIDKETRKDGNGCIS